MAKKYSNIDLSEYEKGYKASSAVNAAYAQKSAAESAVSNYGPFQYGNQAAYDKALNDIINRKDFTYDLNGDMLYQQYKDNYINQGKQAMMDTMGQASAMTGGYGNSYAATVGNQTYQGYLQQLNNIVPELYKLALDKYNADGNRLNNNFNVLSSDRATAYGEYQDGYNRLVSDRDYYANNYDAAYQRDYNAFTDQRNYDQTQYWNEYNAGYQAERDAIADAQWQKEFNEAMRQYNQNFAYQQQRDSVADSQWQSEFDENNRRYNQEYEYQQGRDAIADAQWQKQFDTNNAQWEKEYNESVRQYNADYALQKQKLENDLENDFADVLDSLVESGALSEDEADDYFNSYISSGYNASIPNSLQRELLINSR